MFETVRSLWCSIDLRDGDHLLRSDGDRFIVLFDERLGPDFQSCDIGVLVQHMDVVIGRNAIDWPGTRLGR